MIIIRAILSLWIHATSFRACPYTAHLRLDLSDARPGLMRVKATLQSGANYQRWMRHLKMSQSQYLDISAENREPLEFRSSIHALGRVLKGT